MDEENVREKEAAEVVTELHGFWPEWYGRVGAEFLYLRIRWGDVQIGRGATEELAIENTADGQPFRYCGPSTTKVPAGAETRAPHGEVRICAPEDKFSVVQPMPSAPPSQS